MSELEALAAACGHSPAWLVGFRWGWAGEPLALARIEAALCTPRFQDYVSGWQSGCRQRETIQ